MYLLKRFAFVFIVAAKAESYWALLNIYLLELNVG